MRRSAGNAMLVGQRLMHAGLRWEKILNKKAVYWTLFGLFALAMAAIQFIPSAPLVVPAQLAAQDRESHRLLNFEGIHNFRDLGGHPGAAGKSVRWGSLYRSANLSEASRADQQA